MTDASAQPTALSLDEIARLVAGRASGNSDVLFDGVAPLEQATSSQIGFLAARTYLRFVEQTGAGALLVRTALLRHLEGDRAMVVVDDPHAALRLLLGYFHPPVRHEGGVHSTAIIGERVEVGEGSWIGPHVVLEDGVHLGARTHIGSHTIVGAESRVGDDSTLHPHVVVYPGVELGARVIVHAGARLGVDGFGYVFEDGGHQKVPQVGGCVIEDDVEIGANTCIDRGSIGSTRIGAGTKIDNLVHIAHNVVVGAGSLIVAQVGIAGSSRVGKGVMLGGQVGVSGHLEIGDGARLGAQAGVIGDVPSGETFWGTPARPRTETLRRIAGMAKIEDFAKRIKALEDAQNDSS